jgi:hypothetical protein
VIIQRMTGVQLAPSVVRRLLRERLGWTVQRPEPPTSAATAASDDPSSGEAAGR